MIGELGRAGIARQQRSAGSARPTGVASRRAASARPSLLLLALLLGGCASDGMGPVSIPYWQRSLERYVWEQGNGDPNVLRDMSWDDVHRGFAVMSDPLPDRSTDAIGLWLAHQSVAGQKYFIFLVGVMRAEEVQDIRPIALNVKQGRFKWSVGAEQPKALAVYRRHVHESQSLPRRFPAPDDTFQVEIEKDRISIVHDQSGAAWQVLVG